MSEQRVPYQAGEPAEAEKSLGRVALEALRDHLRAQGWRYAIAATWEDLNPPDKPPAPIVQDHTVIAAAVEAEVLRRTVAYLERVCDEPWPRSLTVEKVLDALRAYAEQQRER